MTRTLATSPLLLLCCAVACCVPGGVLAQADLAGPRGYTLQEAIAYAEAHAPSVRAAQADLAEADGQIRETTSIGIPKVNASVGYTHFIEIPQTLFPDFITPTIYGVLNKEGVLENVNPAPAAPQAISFQRKNSFDAGVNARALLFDATFFIALKGARLYRNLAVRTLEQTAYQTHVQVSRAYLATLLAQENEAVVDRNLANLATTLEETRAIFEAGFAERLDVDRLELSLANLRAQRETLDQLEQVSLNLLKFQMGYPVTEPIGLATDLATALGEAQGTELMPDEDFSPSMRPEYATLALADSLSAIDLRRIRAGYYPSLMAVGGFQRTLQRDNLFDETEASWLPNSYVGVTLDVPLFDGFLKKAQRQRALARQDKTRIQIQQFEQQSRLALANGRASVLNARLSLQQREAAERLAEEIYGRSKIKFNEGVGSSIEVKQAEGELYAAQGARLQALYDLAVAYTDYEDALGQL